MTNYHLLARQLSALTEDLHTPLPALANCSALLWEAMPQLNWCGFYITQGEDVLLLGPFQGKSACVRIPFGKGVCGTAAASRAVQLVPDVHLFPGHIACDSASESEIVIPLIADEKVVGVLDIDSPVKARFTEEDAAGLQLVCEALMAGTDWSSGLI